ncbi:DUF3237 domain-containing protein [Larsenimonas rhizosphaerae]|uniref:DUF3237 domain-containing protein n=1 Tax=Larsenimonas rhizosphaerae TaxID=2944682 RepID=A0AA41ZGH5_9GAMM|nr:DUF3237 domain-containing protein [Larsenimonas rhizosphaerae]MCX2524206.1 DUF3237 domain-containing protein [Larsenimonas rhizosphaerae]
MATWNSLPSLSFLTEAEVHVAPPHELGHTGQGERLMFAIEGGRFSGPGLSGTILPGGADWAFQVSRTRIEISAHYLVEREDGVVLEITNEGTSCEVSPGIWQGETVARFRSRDPVQNHQMMIGRMRADTCQEPGIIRLAFWQVVVKGHAPA